MPSRFTSEIKLYEVHDIGNGRFPAFSTSANQTQYFESKKKATISNCKLVRGVGTVRVNVSTKSFYKSLNYLSYKNPDYDNKVIYAFITGYKYINDQCTELSFAIDFIQTFMFDVECVGADTVLDREHLSQARKALAVTNPFNKELWELETAEPLPVGTNLEKRDYTFETYQYGEESSGALNKDAFKLFAGSNTTMCVVYISKIDFTGLDEYATEHSQTLPSTIWSDFITNAATPALGFSIDFDGTVTANSQYAGTDLLSYFPNACAILCLQRSSGTNNYTFEKLAEYLVQWNCVSAIVNVVVATEAVLNYAFFNMYQGSPWKAVSTFVPANDSIHNEKLYRFPFQYLRLITPDYNVKELRYEWFKDINGPDTPVSWEVEIGIGTDIINGLTIVAAPVNYKNDYQNIDSNTDIDTSEGVFYSGFPTAPYNIDAFLAQMSATAAERTRTDTLTNAKSINAEMYGLGARKEEAYAVTEGMSTVIGSMLGDVSGGFGGTQANFMEVPNVAKGVMDLGITQNERQLQWDAKITDLQVTANAAAYLVGDDSGIFAQNYKFLKGTYAVNHYVQPSGEGFRNYTLYGFLNICCQKVKLRQEIVDMYDDYFSSYGYKSGRMGEPYVMSFIRGGTDSPEWINGETYCKTSTAHFKGTFEYVCKLWADTFNAGIHWLNGDELING